jgi:hypothetical protein
MLEPEEPMPYFVIKEDNIIKIDRENLDRESEGAHVMLFNVTFHIFGATSPECEHLQVDL